MKTIPLTQGQVAIVDDRDAPALILTKWKAVRKKGLYWYAQRNVTRNGKRTGVGMHSQIMGFPKCLVDHRNGDTLDNRRRNLRKATHSQNRSNSTKRRDWKQKCTSKFVGVFRNKRGCRWVAHITHGGRMKRLGLFDSPEAAALAYNKAALLKWGDFAKLNKL